jgi:hypothetical protein
MILETRSRISMAAGTGLWNTADQNQPTRVRGLSHNDREES